MAESIRFKYQTFEIGNSDFHIRSLRDNQQFSDDQGVAENLGISSANWPLFGIMWASGEVLARLMVDEELKGRSILEVGCGLGLASLVLNRRLANITATDQHPEAAGFLEKNTRLNDDRDIPFIRTGWAEPCSRLGKFDLIIGSDLLYERNHADLLAAFIEEHAASKCEVVLIDPGRKHHGKFTRRLQGFGFDSVKEKSQGTDAMLKSFAGFILRYTRKN